MDTNSHKITLGQTEVTIDLAPIAAELQGRFGGDQNAIASHLEQTLKTAVNQEPELSSDYDKKMRHFAKIYARMVADFGSDWQEHKYDPHIVPLERVQAEERVSIATQDPDEILTQQIQDTIEKVTQAPDGVPSTSDFAKAAARKLSNALYDHYTSPKSGVAQAKSEVGAASADLQTEPHTVGRAGDPPSFPN